MKRIAVIGLIGLCVLSACMLPQSSGAADKEPLSDKTGVQAFYPREVGGAFEPMYAAGSYTLRDNKYAVVDYAEEKEMLQQFVPSPEQMGITVPNADLLITKRYVNADWNHYFFYQRDVGLVGYYPSFGALLP